MTLTGLSEFNMGQVESLVVATDRARFLETLISFEAPAENRNNNLPPEHNSISS